MKKVLFFSCYPFSDYRSLNTESEFRGQWQPSRIASNWIEQIVCLSVSQYFPLGTDQEEFSLREEGIDFNFLVYGVKG